MENHFENDPFVQVFRAFAILFPSKQFTCLWVQEATDDEGNTVGGTTEFFDDGRIPIICISASLSVADALEVLAHELAHVAVGLEEGHGSKWEAAFDLILQEYCRYWEEREKELTWSGNTLAE